MPHASRVLRDVHGIVRLQLQQWHQWHSGRDQSRAESAGALGQQLLASMASLRQTPQQLTLLLGQEISNVRTAMRYNPRWAVVPSYYVRAGGLLGSRACYAHPPRLFDSRTHLFRLLQEEDRNEPNEYDAALRALRSQIFQHRGTCVWAARP